MVLEGFRTPRTWELQAHFTDRVGAQEGYRPPSHMLLLSLICLFCVCASPRKAYKKGHGHCQTEAWENFENSSEWKTAPLKFGKPGSFCSAQDPWSPAKTSAPRRVALLPHPREGLASSRQPSPSHEHLLLQRAELANTDRRPFSSCLE